ncbi:GTPase ObgE [Candidatus Mycoplasma pogonae]
MKFIDEINLKVAAGKGGDGKIAFRREAHVDRGGPDGGDGGHGGSIYFVPDHGVNTLLNLYYKKNIQGEDGENGRRKNQYGAKGKDTFVKVPFGTMVYTQNGLIADIIEDRPYLIAKGGKGGRGNTKFKTARNTAPEMNEKGDKGESFELTLSLKIMADVGFVGKPSAGKSTILNRISNAKAKVADYEFTTLVPQLGLVKYEDYSYVVADLPGLIEGANQGKGLGIQFLKHIERCRVICHVVDFGSENKNPLVDFEVINKELKSYKLNLESRPQVVVANKKDLPAYTMHLTAFKAQNPDIKVIEISALEDNDFMFLKSQLFEALQHAKAVVLEEKKASEITITLEPNFIVKKIHEGLFEVTGAEVAKYYDKIPLISHDNLMMFNKRIKDLGVWQELENQGIRSGDTVRIFDYEFTWEEDDF